MFDKGMVDMTLRLAAKGVIPQPLHFNFVMGVNGGIAATHTNLLFLVNSLPQNATFTVSGTGRAQLPMAVMSMLLGGHVRVGFEDNVYLSKGRLLKSNGEMVEKIVRIAKELGREIAAPDEARELLGIPKNFNPNKETTYMEIKGNKYGTHRVIQPKGVLTQAALKIDNGFDTVYSNEIVCDVTSLNIDSASFTQIENECGGDADKIARRIEQIVAERGKMQNPVTGSGGMFIGRVAHIGKDLTDTGLKVGDKIASLVSLSLTPLKIEKILAVHPEIDRVDVVAKAALFESGIYAKLPDDMPENLALAALDVAGAPAQTAKLVKEGDSVLVLGAAGKSGVLVCYEAKKRAGAKGNVVGVVICEEDKRRSKSWGLLTRQLSRRLPSPSKSSKKPSPQTAEKSSTCQ